MAAKIRLCHKCKATISPVQRIGRRETCLACGYDLHCCRNCAFYDPTFHNQCTETQAERQVEKQAGNFCEYFSFLLQAADANAPAPPGADARARLEALFKKK